MASSPATAPNIPDFAANIYWNKIGITQVSVIEFANPGICQRMRSLAYYGGVFQEGGS